MQAHSYRSHLLVLSPSLSFVRFFLITVPIPFFIGNPLALTSIFCIDTPGSLGVTKVFTLLVRAHYVDNAGFGV